MTGPPKRLLATAQNTGLIDDAGFIETAERHACTRLTAYMTCRMAGSVLVVTTGTAFGAVTTYVVNIKMGLKMGPAYIVLIIGKR